MNGHDLAHAKDVRSTIACAVEQVANAVSSVAPLDAASEAERTAKGVAALFATGLLSAPLEGQLDGTVAYQFPSAAAIEVLSRLGGADLSLARLYEGHLNALQLIALYGDDSQRKTLGQATRSGAFYGVWGADGSPAFSASANADGSLTLAGTKRYASGLGLVTKALIPLSAGADGMRLILVDVDDPHRCDLAAWDMRGMRGSRSGTYDFEGLTIGADAEIGKAGDYQIEPYFVGGIWRCAAAQLGAVERLVTVLVETLKATNRFDHPLQTARVGQAIMAARTARLWIEDAASRVEVAKTPDEIARAVSLSAYARLQTETAGMAVIDLVERGIGLASFAHGHPAEAIGRDLAVYLRQANPDALLLEHARVLAAQPLDLRP